ncbi:MAG: hypothetical protein OXE50_04670 [Chloroflexi bacterium]|nr:hypothetical protein [Chloroflexota bacterium]
MRPGLVFIGLFALLMVVYFSLQSTLGTVTTTLLQVGIVLTLLGSALWLRKRFSPPER